MGLSYSGKILFVNLTTQAIEVRQIDEDLYRRYLGGSGLGVRLLTNLTDPTIHPLDQRNALIFVPGLLTGTLVPGATRTFAIGINARGQIAGQYIASGVGHGLLATPQAP